MPSPSRELKGSVRFDLPLVVSFLVFFTTVLNLDVLRLGFIGDDYLILDEVQNRGVHFLGGWIQDSGLYRPFVSASFWVNFKLFGTNALGYHVFNLLLHIGNSVLLFFLLKTIIRAFHFSDELDEHRQNAISFLLTCVFIIHPANVHDVAWISGRTDVLCCFFFLSSFLLYLKFEIVSRKWVRVASLCLFVCALACKETAVVLPFVLLLESYSLKMIYRGIQNKKDITQPLWRVSPYLAVLLVYMIARSVVLPAVEVKIDLNSLGVYEVLALMAKPFFLFVSPFDPMSAYKLFAEHRIVVISVAVSLMGLVGLILTPTFIRYRAPFLRAVAVLIGSMILAVLPYYVNGVITQRLMYIPLVVGVVFSIPLFLFCFRVAQQSTLTRYMAVALGIEMISVYLVSYRNNMDGWISASRLEKQLMDGLVSQLADPGAPIVVMTYPQRVNQSLILWSLPARIHYATHGTFGAAENVRMGFYIVGSSYSSIGSSFEYNRSDILGGSFSIEGLSEFEYPMIDQSDMKQSEGTMVFEQSGRSARNNLIAATIVSVNEIGRPQKYEVKVIDEAFYSKAQVFLFQHGRMVRIQ